MDARPPELVTHLGRSGVTYHWTWEPPRKRTVRYRPVAVEDISLRRWDAPGLAFAEARNIAGVPYALFVFARDEPLASVDDVVGEICCPISGNIYPWDRARLRSAGPGAACLSPVRDVADEFTPLELFWMSTFTIELPKTGAGRASLAQLTPRLLTDYHYSFRTVPGDGNIHKNP